jgi:hypothetical protein
MITRLIFTAYLALAAIPALAGDDIPLPPLTPKGQYLVMTHDDATSSSKCIGSPITPLCTAETALAFYTRGRLQYLKIATGIEHAWLYNVGDSLDNAIRYRVIRREILTDRSFPWTPKRDPDYAQRRMQAGDMRIDIIEEHCDEQTLPASCGYKYDHWSEPRAYIVRRQGDRWILIDWGYPYDLRK